MHPIVNPNDLQSLHQKDSLFATIQTRFGIPPNFQRPEGFVTLCRIILEQQVSLQSANAHFNKLNNYITFLSPGEILKLYDEEMRHCHISRQKSSYLRSLSKAIINKYLMFEDLAHLPSLSVRNQLKNIKGIGDWTADIYLMFCLQDKDIFPIGDVAVVSAMRELTNAKTREEILMHSEKWKPYRSFATYFLWHYYLSKRNRVVLF